MQIIVLGLGRGVNRTARNSLQILTITNRVLALPVDKVIKWEEAVPRKIEIVLVREPGALAGQRNALAARHPDLQGDSLSARNALNSW